MQKRGLTHLLAIAVMASCLRPGPLWSQPVPEQEQRLSPSPSEQPTGCFGAVIEKIEFPGIAASDQPAVRALVRLHEGERLDRNGRRTTRPNRLDERSHACTMTLVLGQLPGLAHAPVAPEGQRPEVLQNGRGAVAQDFQALLARGRVASGHVGDGCERTIAEPNADGDVVIGPRAGSRRDSLRIHRDGRRSREKRAKIDEVASLTDDPAAADRRIVDP